MSVLSIVCETCLDEIIWAPNIFGSIIEGA
jgi:hypothetical protein